MTGWERLGILDEPTAGLSPILARSIGI